MRLLRSVYHYLLALAGHLLHGFPSRGLFIVGVTGTKGKSTTLDILSAVFEAHGATTAVLSTVRYKLPGADERNTTGNSMPGRFAIARFLRRARRRGATHAFVEVTSEGVRGHRHRFIAWDAGIFMNLAPEHIESHGSFEKYRAAKVRFFRYLARSPKRPKFLLVNDDDPNAGFFAAAAKGVPGAELLRFSRGWFFTEAAAHGLNLGLAENRRWLGEWLVPEFNVWNAAAASRLALRAGVSWEEVLQGFRAFRGTPGRMEFVQEKPFAVIVDYAHTPDSFEQALRAARLSFVGENDSLICVFGSAAGGRDTWKRPKLGALAAEYCDAAVLTDEDPFDEDPMTILTEIKGGFAQAPVRRLPPDQAWIIPDRRQAIRKALTLAKPGDVVLMTGKGTETSIRMARGKKLPWDERKVAEEELRLLGKQNF